MINKNTIEKLDTVAKNFGCNENVFWSYEILEPLSLNQTKPSTGSPVPYFHFEFYLSISYGTLLGQKT